MKRILCILLMLSMLLSITPAFAAVQYPFLGEWTSYGTMNGKESEVTMSLLLGDVPPLTTSRVDKKGKSSGFVFNKNQTVDYTENGVPVANGTWTWDASKQMITIKRVDQKTKEVYYEHYFYEPGFLTAQWTIPSGDEPSILIAVYYRPEELSIRASEYYNTGWKLLNFVDNGERTTAFESAVHYCFSLHKDGTASILANYLPRKGTWKTDGYNLVITDDRGNVLNLEPQLNKTLYGTYTRASGKVSLWEFGSIDAFDFNTKPVSTSAIYGTWDMIGLYQPVMSEDIKFPYTRDQLTFYYQLRLSSGTSYMNFNGSNSKSTTKGTIRVVSGPILNPEEHTGTIVIFTYEDGSEKPFWLHKDGSLRGLNPGNMELVFEKEK